MATTLFILNDAPYGNERPYNALRLAGALSGQADENVQVFLLGDAALCAKRGHKLPSGCYDINVMLGQIIRSGEVVVCGTCMDARGIAGSELIDGARRSTLDELRQWTQQADKVLVF